MLKLSPEATGATVCGTRMYAACAGAGSNDHAGKHQEQGSALPA